MTDDRPTPEELKALLLVATNGARINIAWATSDLIIYVENPYHRACQQALSALGIYTTAECPSADKPGATWVLRGSKEEVKLP